MQAPTNAASSLQTAWNAATGAAGQALSDLTSITQQTPSGVSNVVSAATQQQLQSIIQQAGALASTSAVSQVTTATQQSKIQGATLLTSPLSTNAALGGIAATIISQLVSIISNWSNNVDSGNKSQNINALVTLGLAVVSLVVGIAYKVYSNIQSKTLAQIQQQQADHAATTEVFTWVSACATAAQAFVLNSQTRAQITTTFNNFIVESNSLSSPSKDLSLSEIKTLNLQLYALLQAPESTNATIDTFITQTMMPALLKTLDQVSLLKRQESDAIAALQAAASEANTAITDVGEILPGAQSLASHV